MCGRICSEVLGDKESKSLSNKAREEGKTRQQVGDIMLGVIGGYRVFSHHAAHSM